MYKYRLTAQTYLIVINNRRTITDIAVPLNDKLPTTVTGMNLKTCLRMAGR
jgi:hypothetical protein